VEHNINEGLIQLRRQYDRVDQAASVMAQPVAWAAENDYNPVTTWAEGRDDAVRHLREMARMAEALAETAANMPPYKGQ